MDAESVKRAAVVGAGVMGNSIAQVLAQAGIDVALVDIDERLLGKAVTTIQSSLDTLAEHESIPYGDIPSILKRIHPSTDLNASLDGVDFVEEAVPEVPDIKKQVLSQLDALLPPQSVIASNTSGLDVFSFAEVRRPERLVIAHWFNPAHIMPLVEVVPGPGTAPETVGSTVALMERIGKRPIALRGFIRSFIVNRIQNAVASSVMELLGSGIVTPEDVDTAVKYTLGIRLPVVGVVQSWDFMGLDVGLAISRSQNVTFPIIEEKVAAGHLGVKTSKGMYDYAGRSELDILKKRDQMLLRVLDQLKMVNAFEPI